MTRGTRAPVLRLQPSSSSRPVPPREAGRFLSGHSYSKPTQFKPGERPSAATEFAPGQAAHNKLPIGTVRVRVETHTGLSRAWVKVAEPNVWRKRAVLVWESLHGPLPCGSVVHHQDRNSLNDTPENLLGLTRKQHAAEHRHELLAARDGVTTCDHR